MTEVINALLLSCCLFFMGILIGSVRLQAWSLIGMACILLPTVLYLSYKVVL